MKFFDWLDERVGHRAWLREVANSPMVGPPSWARAVGAALGACLLLQLTTGIALMTAYAPDANSAWASVHFIQRIMPHGWLVRGLHRQASHALVLIAGLHVLVLVLQGAYRRPREIAFFIALAYVAVIVLANITGGLLPWDQLGWWARSVELNIVAMGPGGAKLASLLVGGPQLGNIALARAYTAHVVVLPIVLWLLWKARRSIQRRHALASPSRRRYFPGQAARDLALSAFAFAAIAYLAARAHGAPLGAPADPASDYPARPEWFLMWLYELRHRMPRPLEFWGTTMVPLLFGLVIAALPWIDRRSAFDDKGPAFRLRAIAPLLLVCGIIVGLSYAAMKRDKHDAGYQKAIAKWDERATKADAIAMNGVPPDGPIAMLERDPELRGEALFAQHCASCHLLGDLGDPKKSTAPALDGWSTEAWILSMMHDPDGEMRFGRSPYKEQMPSVDVPPKDKPDFQPMSKEDMEATAAFLASLSDEPGEVPEPGAKRSNRDLLPAGEKIVSERCTTCHLYKGEGDDGGQNLAPEFLGYGSLAWVRSQIANPATKATYRDGALDPQLKGHMPRFDDDLGQADIDTLARWVRKRARSSVPRP